MLKYIKVVCFISIILFLNPEITLGAHSEPGDRTTSISSLDCITCHAGAEERTSGPHGGYTNTTNRCSTCHDVHANEGNAQLLPGTTLTAVCMSCHDLTATASGPYNMGGDKIAAAHRITSIDFNGYRNTGILIEGITAIPGGNGVDGGVDNLNTASQGSLSGTVFTCASCHTPHGVNTVKPYLGESTLKVTNDELADGQFKLYLTSRILKRNPNQAEIDPEPTEYGSSWCISCHKGRRSGISDKHNHSVDEIAPAYRFLDLAPETDFLHGETKFSVGDDGYILVDTRANPAENAEMKRDPRSNQQYSMIPLDEYSGKTRPDGFTPFKDYPKGPSCQQCHGNARDVESPYQNHNNPQKTNFPHVSSKNGFLVETEDDLCTNCHSLSTLP